MDEAIYAQLRKKTVYRPVVIFIDKKVSMEIVVKYK